MNKKSQKIAAIGIGFVLSILLIYIGFRIVQKRGSQAGIVQNYTCTPNEGGKSICTWSSTQEDVGRVLYASMPPGGLSECNLVFIAEELDPIVALGDGNFEHSVTLQPLVAGQSYCAAVAGNEDNIIEIALAGTGSDTTDVASPSPTPPLVQDPEPTSIPLPTTAEELLPTAAPTLVEASDADIDAYYADSASADSDWGDCLDYFEKKGQQVSGNACIKGYYRHNESE